MPETRTMRFIFLLGFLSFSATSLAYTITGQLKGVQNCYYPKACLEVIRNMDGFFSSSPQNIVTYSDLDKDGRFVISGAELPEEKLFYRLYFNKTENNASSIHTGLQRNYILLLLNNQSEVFVECENFCEYYFSYTVHNSAENHAIAQFQDILNEHGSRLTDSMSVTKREFAVNSEIRDIRNFMDTNQFALVNLYALTETDIDGSYYTNQSYYDSMLVKILQMEPSSVYARQYKEKLELLKLQKQIKEGGIEVGTKVSWVYILLGCSALLNILFAILYFRRKPLSSGKGSHNSMHEEARIKILIGSLSIKEREILLMLHEGLSNKEIADNLNVELSTIKTHVGRIYQKTGISSRKEVASIAKHL